MVRSELQNAGWDEPRWNSTAKGHAVEVGVASRLRAETTVTYEWIAERSRMSSRLNVSNLVSAKRKCRK